MTLQKSLHLKVSLKARGMTGEPKVPFVVRRLWSCGLPWVKGCRRETEAPSPASVHTANSCRAGTFTRPRQMLLLTLRPQTRKAWTPHLLSRPFPICVFHVGKVRMRTLERGLPQKYETAYFKTLEGYKAVHSTKTVTLKTRFGWPSPYAPHPPSPWPL